jgi:hypothetical protein
MVEEIESHILKRYELLNKQGKGAYGVVFKAMDKRSHEIVALKKKYKLHISEDFIRFISDQKNTCITNVPIIIDGEEYIIGSFITTDEEMNGSDLYNRYVMCPDETVEYLAFACGFDNDEFSIKVKGEDLGSIYHVDNPDEETFRIRKIFDSFEKFANFINERNF